MEEGLVHIANYSRNNYPYPVLILIVVEEGLVHKADGAIKMGLTVLILIVVEEGLVLLKCQQVKNWKRWS